MAPHAALQRPLLRPSLQQCAMAERRQVRTHTEHVRQLEFCLNRVFLQLNFLYKTNAHRMPSGVMKAHMH